MFDSSLWDKLHKYYLDLAGTGVISYLLGARADVSKATGKMFRICFPLKPSVRVTQIMVEKAEPDSGGELISGHIVVDASNNLIPTAIEAVKPVVAVYKGWDWWEFQQPDGSWGKVYSLSEKKVYTLRFRASFIEKISVGQIAWLGPFKGYAFFRFTGIKKPVFYAWDEKRDLAKEMWR